MQEEDHALRIELSSLRHGLASYQSSSHKASIQLQQTRMEGMLLHERISSLEEENKRLREEVETLRSTPVTIVSETASQLTELTLAHRRVNDKLTLTEENLAQALVDLTNTKAFLGRAEMERDAAVDSEENSLNLASKLRASLKEEELRRRQVEVDKELCESIIAAYEKGEKAPAAEPSTSEVGTTSALPTSQIPDLQAGRAGLQRLLEDFHHETSSLNNEIARLTSLSEELASTLAAERHLSEAERKEKAEMEAIVLGYKSDDLTASGVVERYMTFAQGSTRKLHASLRQLRTRHAATLATLTTQITRLQKSVALERGRSDALQAAVGEMSEGLSRETDGRRREISLRLSSLSREERILEVIRRWQEKAKGSLRKLQLEEEASKSTPAIDEKAEKVEEASTDLSAAQTEGLQADLLSLIREAAQLLPTTIATLTSTVSPEAARVLLAEDLVTTLVQDLQQETERRIALEAERVKLLAQVAALPPPEPLLTNGFVGEKDDVESFEYPIPSAPPMPSPHLAKSPILHLSSDDPLPVTEAPASSSTPAVVLTPPLPEGQLGVNSSAASEPVFIDVPVAPEVPVAPSPAVDPILSALRDTASRYTSIQQQFQICHSSIAALKQTLTSSTIPHAAIFLTAVERLEDVTEDARVELEINIDDEVRISKGYETLLALPPSSSAGNSSSEEAQSIAEKKKIKEAKAFVNGKAKEAFQRRLEDLQYDIAALKSAIHAASFDEREMGDEQDDLMFDPLAALNLRNVMPVYNPHAQQQQYFQPSPSMVRKTSLGGSLAGLFGGGTTSPKPNGAAVPPSLYKNSTFSASQVGLGSRAGVLNGEDSPAGLVKTFNDDEDVE